MAKTVVRFQIVIKIAFMVLLLAMTIMTIMSLKSKGWSEDPRSPINVMFGVSPQIDKK